MIRQTGTKNGIGSCFQMKLDVASEPMMVEEELGVEQMKGASLLWTRNSSYQGSDDLG